jgi:NH3-dependent NAD+ synthetase
VYALARWANREKEVIPWASIDKVPSAELRPNQKDEDSLPPYPVLDRILQRLIEERKTIPDTASDVGVSEELVRDISNKLYAAEFKRKQFPPTLRVSSKAWVGRVYPLAHRFRG